MRVLRQFLWMIVVTGCAMAGPPPKPLPSSVVLITLDTTRADRMGFLGSQRGLTPNLDGLAAQSVVFSRAYAQVPLTTPSHAALLTSTFPQFNHVVDLGDALSDKVPFLPQLLHQRGYKTAAFVGAAVLDPSEGNALGFDRGFDTYDAGFHHRSPGEDRYQSEERRGDVVVDRALAWLGKHSHGPVFLWVHLYDPHDPYEPPEPYKSKYAADPYDGEIAYADAALGRLLAGLRKNGLYQNAVIAFAADHGEAFGEHGERTHGVFLYDETIHVPLLLKLPAAQSAGKRIDSRVGLVDVAATVLQALGSAPPPEMQGQSLMGLIKDGGPADVDRSVYSESEYARLAFGWADLHSWRASKYLYVEAPKRELYDQTVDPGALHNLAEKAAAVADTMASQLGDFRHKTTLGAPARPPVDPKVRENLAALGYVASSGASPDGDKGKTAADPKDLIEVANLMHEGMIDVQVGRYQDAVPKLERAIKQDPAAGMLYLELGNAQYQLRQIEGAVASLTKAVELMPQAGVARSRLAQAYMAAQNWEGAAEQFKAAMALSIDSVDVHVELGLVDEKLQQFAEAMQEYEKALAMSPLDYRANLCAGRLLGMHGSAAQALPYLQKAETADPNSQDAHRFLAKVYTQLGKEDDAAREQAEADRLKK